MVCDDDLKYNVRVFEGPCKEKRGEYVYAAKRQNRKIKDTKRILSVTLIFRPVPTFMTTLFFLKVI